MSRGNGNRPSLRRTGGLRNLFSQKGPSFFHRGVPTRLADALPHITLDGLNTVYYIILLIQPQGGSEIFPIMMFISSVPKVNRLIMVPSHKSHHNIYQRHRAAL